MAGQPPYDRAARDTPITASDGRAAPLVRPDPYDASWRERVAVLGAMAGILVLGLLAGFVFAHRATAELLGLMTVSFFAAGKLLPLWGVSGESSFSPWQLGLVIWVMDTFTVLIIVYALELFYRFGRLKRALARVQESAELVLAAYPRMRRAAVVGVVLFVLFPVAGTGALVGTFVGILLGMRRQVLIAAVSFGGLVGGMLMAFAAIYFAGLVVTVRNMQQQVAVKWGILAGLVALLVLGVWALNRAYRRALVRAERDVTAHRRGE